MVIVQGLLSEGADSIVIAKFDEVSGFWYTPFFLVYTKVFVRVYLQGTVESRSCHILPVHLYYIEFLLHRLQRTIKTQLDPHSIGTVLSELW